MIVPVLVLVVGTLHVWCSEKLGHEEFVAKVIYCESASASPFEMYYVGCVIRNRIDNPAFKWGTVNNKDGYQVVTGDLQFSCIGDRHNVNWWLPTKLYNSRMWSIAKSISEKLVYGDCKPSDTSIVYYHDRSIKKPKNWDNKYWNAVLVRTTEHFKFYKIESAWKEAK